MSVADFKRMNFRRLPGDIPKEDKIALLEGKVPEDLAHVAKGFKKDFARKANRKQRRKSVSTEE